MPKPEFRKRKHRKPKGESLLRNGHFQASPILTISNLEKLSLVAMKFLILIVRHDWQSSFSHVFVFRLLYGKKKWGTYAAILRLPNEVLFDSFKFLNRRQLTNLESVCLRFHRIISNNIGETPFLRLQLDIGFRFDARFLLFYFWNGS